MLPLFNVSTFGSLTMRKKASVLILSQRIFVGSYCQQHTTHFSKLSAINALKKIEMWQKPNKKHSISTRKWKRVEDYLKKKKTLQRSERLYYSVWLKKNTKPRKQNHLTKNHNKHQHFLLFYLYLFKRF